MKDQTTLLKALIYCRVSTEEQAGDDRHSLKTQRNLCEKAILESGKYRLAENGIYEDPGKSATNMNRLGLQDMLIRIQEDKSIRAVFIQDTDRLARNVNDHLTIKALLRKHSAEVISISQLGLEDTPEGNFMDIVIAGVNQLQSQITGRKTIKSMEQKFWEGGWPTHAPLGYLNVGKKEDDEERTVIIDDIRGPLIAEGFKLYATGDYSVLEIRDMLHKKGLRTKSGKMLAHSKMAQILKNHFFYGEMHWRGLINKGKHKPLTDKEIFDRCQLIMGEHIGWGCRRRKFNFILRGFVRCALCDYRYTAEHHHKKKKSYYHCSRYGNKNPENAKCMDKSVDVEDLENQVEVEFSKIQFSPEFILKIETRLKKLYESKRSSVTENRQKLTQAKITLEQKLEQAEEKLISGVLDNAGFERAKRRYREQIENFEDELIKLERSKNIKVDVIQQVLALIRNIGESYEEASPELKRLYLGLFWDHFKAANREITEAVKSPIVRALETAGQLTFKELRRTPFEPQYSRDEQKVILRNERGAYRDSNPGWEFHKLQC